MFLRAENDNPEARAKIAAVDAEIQALRESLGPIPCPDEARARLDLAGILCWRGHYRLTLELLEPLTTDAFPEAVVLEASQMIGDSHYRHDQYDLASRQYHENLERAKAAGAEYWCARAEDGIAWVLIDVGHYTTGEFEEAGRLFERQLPLHQKMGNRICEAMILYGMSRAAAGTGDYGPAIELAHQSVEVLQGSGAEFFLHLPLLQLANVHRDRGSFEEARPFYDLAVDAADRSQDPYGQVLTALDYGIFNQYVNEPNLAMEIWRVALPAVKDLDFPRLGHELSNRMALAAADRGDYEEAYRFQVASQAYGNQVGVLSSILHNQQMLLRDQMHQAAQLQDTLNDLQAGFEASIDGIFVLEKQDSVIDGDAFVIRFVNQSGAQMLGRKPTHILHVQVKSAWKLESADQLLAPSLEVFASGEPLTIDPIELEFSEGDSRWYSVKIAKIPDGVVWTVSDVTARETMQREILAQRDRLRQTNIQLTALDREKSEMLGIAAHDLRSPIGNIRSLCELISPDEPETLEYLRTIEDISDSLLHLIENLLDVERIERGELELELGDVELGPLVSHLVEQFSADAAQKGIAIHFEPPPAGLQVRADASAIRRILQNLISNALKFSPAGSPVYVRALQIGAVSRIEVEDRGQGISEADKKKLFGKFARLSARPTGGESSTGLGLSIVKRLVDAMGGQAGCDSVFGLGSTFWVEFAAGSLSGTGAGSRLAAA